MRRIGMAAAAVLIAVALGACSGGNSATAFSLEEVHDKIVDAGIACNGKVGPPSADDIDFGFEISKEFNCTIDGTEIVGTEFASESDTKAALSTVKNLSCKVGADDYAHVSDGNWLVQASGADSGDTDAELTKEIADALDTKVRSFNC